MKIARASRADRTDVDGTVFDSASELRRWRDLRMMETAGAISGLRRQVVFNLYASNRGFPVPIKIRSPRYKNGRACVWTADFAYLESGITVYEEFKPVWNDVSRLRIAIAEACHGITVRITGGGRLIGSKRPKR